MFSEIRKSYFLNKYVIITPGRAKRPRYIVEKTFVETDAVCVFCPETLDKKLLVKTYPENRKDWQIAVLRNKYPSVTPNSKKAYGVQEVIVETPRHDEPLGSLKLEKILLYLKVLADRLINISKNAKIEYILEFKNEGSKAGATIKHSHSQIFATALLPPDVYDELQLANGYKNEHATCPYCDILRKELRGPRRIYSDKYVGAFAPYASEYHYEAWIFPKRHADNIAVLSPHELKSLAKALKLILAKLEKRNISYNFFLHQVVSWKDQHFYIKIQPRDSNIWAGVELGSGLVINSVSPETAAEFYRK